MTALTLVVHYRIRPGKTHEFEQAMHGMIEAARQEDGCINYDLFVDTDDPGHYILYETWASRTAWDGHMSTSHVAQFRSVKDSMVAESTLQTLTRVE